MFHQFKKILAPPVFPGDEDKTRIVAMLNTAMIATMVILTITLPLYGFYTIFHILFITPFIILSLIVLILIRRGHLYLTTRMAIVVYWVFLTIACWFNGGPQSVAFIVYIVPIVWGALTFGVYGLVLLTGLSILSGLGMALAGVYGWLPQPLTTPHPFSELATNITIFVMIGFAVYQSMRFYQAALQKARQSERLLRDTEVIARVGSWRWDIGSQVETWSEGEYHNLGFEPGSVTPSHDLFLDSIDAEDHPIIKKALTDAIDEIHPYETEFHRTSADGQRRTYITRGDIKRDLSGKPLAIFGMTMDITDLRHSEEERARLTAILENTSDFIGMAQPDGRLTYLNSAGRRMVGWKIHEDVTCRAISEIHPPWVMQKIDDEAIPTAKREGYWQGETAVVDSTGREIPVNQIIMAHHSIDGKLLFLSTTIRDMSEQRAVEQALRESEERFRIIANQAPIMIGVSDENGTINFLNKTWLDFRGKTIEKGVYWDWTEGVHPEDYDRVIMNMRISINNREPYSMEYRVQDKNKEYHWILDTSIPTTGVDGQPSGYINTAVDISERKQIEKALRESEENFRKIFDVNPFPLGISRIKDSKAMLVNRAILDLTETSPDEIDSMKGLDFYADPEDRRRIIEALKQDGRKSGVVLNLRKKSGEIRRMLMNAFPIRYAGEDCLLVGMADLTEQIEAEEEVRRLNSELELRVKERTAQLETANRELESFSYSVSHDLRTPLRSINGFATILSEEYSDILPSAAKKYLQRIEKAAVHMGLLIDDLLMFARLNRQPINKHTLQPAEILKQVFDEMSGEYEGRQVTLSIGEMPECHADPILLKAVLENLLSNAIKYTRPRPQALIEAGSLVKNGHTVYYIKDNGVGFNMEYYDKLFGVFQRLHGKDEFEGTGVGLATVQHILHRHGGDIWAESVEGYGATFFFTLDEVST